MQPFFDYWVIDFNLNPSDMSKQDMLFFKFNYLHGMGIIYTCNCNCLKKIYFI